MDIYYRLATFMFCLVFEIYSHIDVLSPQHRKLPEDFEFKTTKEP